MTRRQDVRWLSTRRRRWIQLLDNRREVGSHSPRCCRGGGGEGYAEGGLRQKRELQLIKCAFLVEKLGPIPMLRLRDGSAASACWVIWDVTF